MKEIKNAIATFYSHNRQQLLRLPDKIEFGYQDLEFFKDENALLDGQVGYAISSDYQPSLGWDSDWLVIGRDNQIGDPIFIDLKDAEYPIYTAIHGQGIWKASLIAYSLTALIEIIQILADTARNRNTPKLLNENPISEIEKKEVIKRIEEVNKLQPSEFWEGLLDN